MGHPAIENRTKFEFAPLFLADERGQSLFVPVVKATYSLTPGGPPILAEKQLPVNPVGEFFGEPDQSSYKYEPETAFFKAADAPHDRA